jgi:flavodoxin
MMKIKNRGKKAMKNIIVIFLTLLLGISLTACKNNNGSQNNNNNQTNKVSKSDKILIVYFSREGNTSSKSANSTVDATARASFPMGNTRIIADQIHETLKGDIFEIQTLETYPSDYDVVVDQAKKEQDSSYKPALKTKAQNMESYDVIFIGYPNWWGTLPMAVEKFLSDYDLSGKTIMPFTTHEGSSFGRSIDDIKKLCPNSTIADGFEVMDKDAKNAKNDVLKWLKSLGMIE